MWVLVFQLFVIRCNTAQILEREQEEEKKKIISKNPDLQGDAGGGGPTAHPALPELTASQQSAANESGVWRESESGLEWLPSENTVRDAEEVGGEGGTTGAAERWV